MRLTLTGILVPVLLSIVSAQHEVVLRVDAPGCPTAPQLYTFNGFGFTPERALTETAPGHYEASLDVRETAFRYLGGSPADALSVIIGKEDTLTVSAACGKFRQGRAIGSPLNDAYARLKAAFEANQETYSTLQQDIEVIRNARVNAEGRKMMAELDAQKLALLREQEAIDPLLGRIAALNTYTSWYSADTSAFSGPLEHFISTYFDRVDFSDPGYNDLSWTYEATRNFTESLSRVRPTAEFGDVLLAETSRWPAGSRARFLARSGALASLIPLKHPATSALADAVVEEYASVYPGPVATLQRQTASLRSFFIGAPAPLFFGATPEGDTLSLQELQGKYVLLDFWASWCGPCRRENPNVVRVYEKYKEAGFEILGISLDDRRERWLQAIAADGLTWRHVSDLRGWRSEHAQLYGVTSIPQTVLLDPDGHIVARNLRGADLERKLRELLGAK